MWRFKPFMPKEQVGLEGRSIDVGNFKLQVQNVIAEGGFSCVYLARDVINPTKQYALKRIICNDEESLELVMKEITVMKLLKGHPNIVPLCAHTLMDTGRTKEALLVMEFCEKSLVNVLESRGAGYFDEKQVLSIFRDICNAVFAMHCHSPPIAHRDLKAENILLGSDGLWKLCDFGSTSTTHKRFEKAEEMGIEEDNIRKHTTPAYRSPEMWDLFRRELINEKVDIWALGCLLFRICYFKSAFDGESKLQILNGNYRIPELPRYSSSITDLIRDMLQSSPDARPDITQVWFRVNEQLPVSSQKSLPDRPPEMRQAASDTPEGILKPANKSSPMPRRSPPPPPSSKEPIQNLAPAAVACKVGGDGGPLGAFWATQHAKDSVTSENKRGSEFDEKPNTFSTSKHENVQNHPVQKNMHGMNFFQEVSNSSNEKPKLSNSEDVAVSQNESFNAFVAEFDPSKLSSGNNSNRSGNEQVLETEVERLNEQLQQANMEKAEITSKYEKLSAICRSQRQEIQELKQALAARTPSPNKGALRNQSSPIIGGPPSSTQREKTKGTIWELQQGVSNENSQTLNSKAWQPFAEDPKPQTLPKNNNTKSVRTRSTPENKQRTELTSSGDSWGFGTESFTAAPSAGPQPIGGETNSRRFGDVKKMESNPASQPAGWAGF